MFNIVLLDALSLVYVWHDLKTLEIKYFNNKLDPINK